MYVYVQKKEKKYMLQLKKMNENMNYFRAAHPPPPASGMSTWLHYPWAAAAAAAYLLLNQWKPK